MGLDHEISATNWTATALSSLISPVQWGKVVNELHLTPRQAEIVRLVLAAKKDKQIAMELQLSVATVRMHLRYVFADLHVADRMELALRVFQILCRSCGHAALCKADVSTMMYCGRPNQNHTEEPEAIP